MNKICVLALAALLAASLAGCVNRSQGASLDARAERQDVQIQRINPPAVDDSRPGQAETWAQLQSMRQDLNSLNGKIYDLYEAKNTEVDMLKQRVYRLENVVRKMASQMAINVDSLDAPISLDGPRTLPEGYAPYTPAPANPAHPVSSGYSPPAGTPVSASPEAAYGAGVPSTPGNTGIAVAPDGNLSGPGSGASGGRDTATTLYDSGITAFDERRYQDAVMAFKDFTATFPSHRLAGNAHFWEGESYFQLKEYARAALAYQEVISKHPGSSKIQSSMLKQGIALYNANKKTAARERLNELVSRYPGSQEASRAKQFLAKNK